MVFYQIFILFFFKLATRFLNAQTGEFLQAIATVVSTNKEDNCSSQNWGIRDYGRLDWVFIYNQATADYLGSNEQGKVFQSCCEEHYLRRNYFKWRFVGQTIINVETGRALESNNSRIVYTNPVSGQPSQNWLQL
jgi:hypothetical protein